MLQRYICSNRTLSLSRIHGDHDNIKEKKTDSHYKYGIIITIKENLNTYTCGRSGVNCNHKILSVCVSIIIIIIMAEREDTRERDDDINILDLASPKN